MINKAHIYQKTHPQHTFNKYFELVVAHQLVRRPDFFFIQVGANDGIMGDELRPLVLKYGLEGVCVEPLSDKFAALSKTYSDQPQVRLIKAALHPTEKNFTIYRTDKSAENLPLRVQGIASFDRQHVIKELNNIGAPQSLIIPEPVECIQFDQIFTSSNKDHLELLQIDTEGFDFEIIKMLDLGKIRPAIIRFEIKHLNDNLKHQCLDYLANNNYKMIYDRIDVIAIDQATIN